MEFAAWLLVAAAALVLIVFVVRLWLRDEPSPSDGGFYAADVRNRDDDDGVDAGEGDGGAGD